MNRTGEAWPATIGAAEARQIGAVVAIDEKTRRTTRPIWGMGRHNHENSVAIPGYGQPVVLSGDDSFVSNPAQAQLYSYIADELRRGLERRGRPLGLRRPTASTTTTTSRSARPMSVTGKFVKVPKDVATGTQPDGTELMAADKGYPPPPNDGTWQRDARTGARHRRPAVGARALGRHAAAEGVRVRAGRGHRLRQAAGHAERRSTSSTAAAARQSRPAPQSPFDARRTAASGSSCSTRTTRRRCVVLDPDRGRRRAGQGASTRSTSRTTSSRRRRAS